MGAITFLFSFVLLLSSCKDVALEEVSSGETLCLDYYQACINPILTKPIIVTGTGVEKTCSAEGCHNVDVGSGGALKLYRRALAGSAEMTANYISAKAFTNIKDPAISKLLLEPLAGSYSIVGSHAGGDIFLDPSDRNYQEIYYWISNPVETGTAACPTLDRYPEDPNKRCLAEGS